MSMVVRGAPAAVVVVAGLSALAAAETLSVPSPSFSTIQSAIDASENGDVIEVGPGTYVELIDFLGKDIVVRGVEGAESTTIDGDGLGSVVTFVLGETSAAKLEGFTLINGAGAPDGGGILVVDASPTIDACVVTACVANGSPANQGGGGIAVRNNSSPFISRTVFYANTSSLGGGALAILGATPTFFGCVFADNEAQFGGGCANEQGSPASYINTTFVNNFAPVAPGICNFQSTSIVRNCIVWGHSPNIFNVGGGNTTASYSLIGEAFPGEGNINADPLFVPDAKGAVPVFALSEGSPAIDAGNEALASADLPDADGDGDTSELYPYDVKGAARVQGKTIDMGASEFVAGGPECNAADLAKPFGTLDIADVVAFLRAFGASEAPADLGAPFGSFDIADVVAFLRLFGDGCP